MDATGGSRQRSSTASQIKRRLVLQGLFASTMIENSCAQVAIKQARSIDAPNVTRIAWSLDNKWIAASSEPASYTGIWNAADGENLWNKQVYPPATTVGITFVDDSKQLAAICNPGDGRKEPCACLMSADSGRVLERLTDVAQTSSDGAIPTFMSASADQSRLAVGFTTEVRLAVISFNRSPRVKWIGPFMSRYHRPVRIVRLVALSPHGSKLAASFVPGEVQVVDVESGLVTCKIIPYEISNVTSLCFVDENILLIASDNSPSIHMGKLTESAGYLMPPEGHRPAAVFGEPEMVQAWNVELGRLDASYKTDGRFGIGEGALTTDGETAIALYRSGYLQKWRISDGGTSPPKLVPGADTIIVSGDAKYGFITKEIAVAASGKIFFVPESEV